MKSSWPLVTSPIHVVYIHLLILYTVIYLNINHFSLEPFYKQTLSGIGRTPAHPGDHKRNFSPSWAKNYREPPGKPSLPALAQNLKTIQNIPKYLPWLEWYVQDVVHVIFKKYAQKTPEIWAAWLPHRSLAGHAYSFQVLQIFSTEPANLTENCGNVICVCVSFLERSLWY